MSGAPSQAPVPTDVESIRNVVLVGPSGAGKSRLFEHIVGLVSGTRAPRAGTDRSTDLRAATVEREGVVITLIDAPGNPDFVGDVRAGLRAADAALFVVSAADGVDATTRALWHECAVVGMPRAVVITQLDANEADFIRTLEDCQAHFGTGVQPLGIPVAGSEGAVTSIADLLLGEIHDYTGGGHRVVSEAREEHAQAFDTYRGALIEGIIEESEDDTLMDRYLDGEDLPFEMLEANLLKAVAQGHFHPVLPASSENGAGIGVIVHLVAAAFPHPDLYPLPTVVPVDGGEPLSLTSDPQGPLVAEVVHTRSDAYMGQQSLVRVFSGTLRTDRAIRVSGQMQRLGIVTGEGHADHDEDVRAGALGTPFDGEMLPKAQAIAGEIVVVTKLSSAQTSDSLSDPAQPLLVTPWALPEALLPVGVAPVSRADEDRMPNAFRELAGEDPTLRIEVGVGQIVLWTTGPAHLDLVLTRLKERFNVSLERVPVRVPLKETVIRKATAQGRHVKQSGGHGQFAVVQMTMEPLPRGTGNEFHETVVGGAVPRQFIQSVEKGALAQLDKGLLAGWPVVDAKVTLFDGKAHSVDSSDVAFQTAAALALKEMASTQTMALLEPIDTVRVTVDDEYLGAIMTDVSTRRGQILGTNQAEDQEGRSVLTASIPQLELLDYAITLRSLAHGTGTFTRELSGYEQLPDRLAKEHLEEDRHA